MKLPEGWKEFELGEVLQYEQPGDYIVNSDEYNDDYETPVLTAGKSFILGYTNEKKGIYTNLPVIIFDDFTTTNHFVTFPFKVKSSAMKLLTPKMKNINLKFVFCMMKGLHHNTITHKRYWISEFQPKKIPIPIKEDGTPNMKKQEKIIKFIEEAEKSKEWRKEADDLTKEFLKSIFWDMFKDNDKLESKKLGDVCDVQSGGTPSRTKKEYWNNGNIPWLGSTVCKDKYVNKSKQFITEEGLKNSSARYFKKGTILVALVGATIGKTAYLNFEATTNQNIAGIYPKEGIELNSEYLFYAMQTLYHRFMSLSSDTFKMANLTFVRNLDIPLPPIELQNKFASIVKEVEAMKEQQKHSKNHIDKLFNALMQKAFKGELII